MWQNFQGTKRSYIEVYLIQDLKVQYYDISIYWETFTVGESVKSQGPHQVTGLPETASPNYQLSLFITY